MDNKDEITIKIYTPYKIINTNAEIDKDTLIFKITKDNIPSNIYFEYKDLTINDSNKKIYYVLAIGAIALIVMILFFSQIKKFSNIYASEKGLFPAPSDYITHKKYSS